MSVLLLFLPIIVMSIHLPKPDGPCPLWIVEEVILLSNTIDVPLGLYSVFQSILNSNMHDATLSLGKYYFKVSRSY